MLTDTVAFPAYTRAAVERAGPFDEELVRNQDDEYNYRLRKLGARILLAADDTLRIEHVAADGTVTVLKDSLPVLAGEVVDGTFMNVDALRRFLIAQVARAKEEGVLFSAHLKATMMKISDPIIFGHVVETFFPAVFDEFGPVLDDAGISANDGLGSLLEKIQSGEIDPWFVITHTIPLEKAPGAYKTFRDKKDN